MTPLTSALNTPTIEQGVKALVGDVKCKVNQTYTEYEQRVRESPGKSVLIALAAGYCLHRLPVRSLLVTQVRLIGALTPPTLLAFGAAKLCEYLQGQARGKSTVTRAPRPSPSLGSFD